MKKLDFSGLKVRLRNGFSDRNKLNTENIDMQINDLDERSRVALINGLHLAWNLTFEDDNRYIQNKQKISNYVLISILSDVYMQEVNYSAYYKVDSVMEIMDNTIKNDTFDSIFSLLEYVSRKLQDIYYKHTYNKEYSVYNIFNNIFKSEYIGYRFIDGLIVPITSEIETETINETLSTKYTSVKRHFEKSLKLLSDRNNPDYENSIKESISGVEAMCSLLLNDKIELGKALNSFEKRGLTIHPALKSAFIKLYGYTSDEDGIRHANGIGGKESTFEEARYMLVSCSAFTNYLKSVESTLNR